jgi:hypothetical protein
MKDLKIFLASSSELYIGRRNKSLVKKGIFIELVIWEDFLDALSPDGLQKEYNKAIRDCDTFVMLYFTKVGKYTAEEFETAIGAFHENQKPQIFTYFKDATISTGGVRKEDMMSLWAFQDKLRELGHYQTVYKSTEDLLLKFGGQLDRILEDRAAATASTEILYGIDPVEDLTNPDDTGKDGTEPRGWTRSKPPRGKVLYKIPAKMQYKNLHRCVIRIANTKHALLKNLNFPEAEATIMNDIRIADQMEVIFVDNPNFDITAINNPIQIVEDDDPTEWNFDVRPLTLGQFPLSFRISIILPNGKKESVLNQAVVVGTETVDAAMEKFAETNFGESAPAIAPNPAQPAVTPTVVAPPTKKDYNLANIIKLLTNAFSDPTLFESFTLINFDEVHRQFTPGMAQSARILQLVTHARSHGKMEALLEAVESENSYQFGQCGPYVKP